MINIKVSLANKTFQLLIGTTMTLLLCQNVAQSALPNIPTGLCIKGIHCVPAINETDGLVDVFPGTNLKFYPGLVVWTTQNESPTSIESRWQQLFSGNRKETYRPPGIFGGVYSQLAWRLYYSDSNVRPKNPEDHTDPAYDWSRLDAVFNINAVQNEGALVALYPGEVGFTGRRVPDWLANSPYDGTFNSGVDGGSNKVRSTPKYYQYTGMNNIIGEIAYFHQALHDHLVATGNINKVMLVQLSEVFVSNTDLPPDYNASELYFGMGLRNKLVASIWAESQVFVTANSVVGPGRNAVWNQMNDPTVGMSFPDLKISNTNSINKIRFSDPSGAYQKDKRLLTQSTEANGQETYTYFASGIQNPWRYSNQKVPQTASHILWALSGKPKGVNKDSKLGQQGEDPPGVMPVHMVFIDWKTTWGINNPTLEQWHTAIDTFGPPGTFAFPYLPPGYK